jgi:hypothetical protein
MRQCASMADDRRAPNSMTPFQKKVFQYEPALSRLQWSTAAKARKHAINCDVFSLNVHNLIECATTCAIKPGCRPHTELLEQHQRRFPTVICGAITIAKTAWR